MRPHILKNLTIFIIGLVLYQVVEALALVPGESHWRGAAISGPIITLVGFALTIWWLVRRFRKMRVGMTPSDDQRQPFTWDKLRNMVPGLLIMVGVQVLSAYVVSTGKMPPSANEDAINQALGTSQVVMLMIVVVFGPIVEELLFRGLLMNLAFAQRNRATQAFNLVLSSVSFALVHVPTNLFDFATYALLGLGLGLTYARTRDLRSGIALHILNNFVACFI
jgi:membrane protease YdiL (CAAX protease family)